MGKLLEVRRPYWICLLLVLATLAVYWQAGGHDFVDYDDDLYVVENRAVRTGLSFKTVAWAFRTTYAANWHPLTWLSHLLDVELYGMKAGAHHLSSVLIHIINTVLLFLWFYRTTNGLWPSALAAALFGLHPLHVESVAQVAGRKDVLSALFWLLTLLAYAGYVKRPVVSRYLLVVLGLSLGLMAKPMVVTLPLVLLLLDYWPLGRFEVAAGAWKKRFICLVWEKVPLLILTAAACVVTFRVQAGGGAVRTLVEYPLAVRTANALVSYIRYIIKTIWPSHLAVFYPHPGMWPLWQVAGAAGLLLLISVWVVRSAKSRPYLLAGWLWYLGTLVPVIGLVQVGSQAMADRYMYVPLVGLSIMLSWGLGDILKRWKGDNRKPVMAAAAVAAVSILAGVSWVQAGHWHNSIRLFSHAIEVTANNAAAHNNLGMALKNRGKIEEAIRHFEMALQMDPKYAFAHNNWGNALSARGKHTEAAGHYAAALQINPRYTNAHYNMGNILFGQGKLDEATQHYQEALRLDPFYVEAINNLGTLLAVQGRLAEAIDRYQRALEIKPEYKEARENLEKILILRQGR